MRNHACATRHGFHNNLKNLFAFFQAEKKGFCRTSTDIETVYPFFKVVFHKIRKDLLVNTVILGKRRKQCGEYSF
ncbi:hypothetical protein SDC9_189288 [bioreactor metagenome]|uniref:Uncharacterized protein n=1 Tax=bioreactor metagenome TaxID=1076179 RepID=A0A645I2L0_9ZZZZ